MIIAPDRLPDLNFVVVFAICEFFLEDVRLRNSRSRGRNVPWEWRWREWCHGKRWSATCGPPRAGRSRRWRWSASCRPRPDDGVLLLLRARRICRRGWWQFVIRVVARSPPRSLCSLHPWGWRRFQRRLALSCNERLTETSPRSQVLCSWRRRLAWRRPASRVSEVEALCGHFVAPGEVAPHRSNACVPAGSERLGPKHCG